MRTFDLSTGRDKADRPTSGSTEHGLQLGRLAAPVNESSLKSLYSNLRDFLTERPAKVRPGTPTAFDMPRFGTGISANLREFLRAAPRGKVNSALLVNWKEEPTLWQKR